ncbi:hypothetical protein [Mesoplasma melaleucae]|uniref:Uncharacterized protein n=1 Tax=Mesoplasma melaleucae TaxID=81459 RepID=A0A2K8NWC7_9MOLU|nr:hypothetical protein [Mesoplasma melaleucae]ATZ18140.1 hypothetical protein EMELA_v1c06320 [Mesoplasma melaleucae]
MTDTKKTEWDAFFKETIESGKVTQSYFDQDCNSLKEIEFEVVDNNIELQAKLRKAVEIFKDKDIILTNFNSERTFSIYSKNTTKYEGQYKQNN